MLFRSGRKDLRLGIIIGVEEKDHLVSYPPSKENYLTRYFTVKTFKEVFTISVEEIYNPNYPYNFSGSNGDIVVLETYITKGKTITRGLGIEQLGKNQINLIKEELKIDKNLFYDVDYKTWKWLLVFKDKDYFINEYNKFIKRKDIDKIIEKKCSFKNFEELFIDKNLKIELINKEVSDYINKYVSQFTKENFQNNFKVNVDYDKKKNCVDWTHISHQIVVRHDYEINLPDLKYNGYRNAWKDNCYKISNNIRVSDGYIEKYYFQYNKCFEETTTGGWSSIPKYEELKIELIPYAEKLKKERFDFFNKNYSMEEHSNFFKKIFLTSIYQSTEDFINSDTEHYMEKYKLRYVEYFLEYIENKLHDFLNNNLKDDQELNNLSSPKIGIHYSLKSYYL